MHATNQSQLRAILDNNVFIEWVPVDLIDRTPYARPISTTMLKRMVEAAKTQTRKQTQDNMGSITLTLQPTGRYNCVDGNHRTALARALGLETILARIVIDLSPEQEASVVRDDPHGAPADRAGSVPSPALSVRSGGDGHPEHLAPQRAGHRTE
jgi:hypothetical protein